MRRAALWIAAVLALGAAPARAQSLAAAHDILGDDPLARQIEQAPITSVTWVNGPNGQRVPLLVGADQPLDGAAGGLQGAGPSALGGLAPHPGLAGLRDAVAAKKGVKAPRQALKQAHHIEAHRLW